jgi:6-bladed beta-propeller
VWARRHLDEGWLVKMRRLLGVVLVFWSVGCKAPSANVPPLVRWNVGEAPLVSIGDANVDSDYLFGAISSAVLTDDGALIVGDRQAKNVRVFAPNGTLVAVFGRPGDGPGEFSTITGVDLLKPDTILVYDGRSQRVTRFSLDAGFVSTSTIDAPSGARPRFYVGSFENGDVALGWIRNLLDRDPTSVTVDSMVLGRFTPYGGFVGELGEGLGLYRFNGKLHPLSRAPHWDIWSDRIFASDGSSEILIWLKEPTQSVDLKLPMDSLETQVVLAEVESAIRGKPDQVRETVATLRNGQAGSPMPVVSSMLVDDKGQVWVKRFDPHSDAAAVSRLLQWPGGTWLIIDRTGSLVAELSMPERFTLLDVRGDRLLGISRDLLGVEKIEVYGLAPGT